ncbi:MAG: chemotaxis protein CheC [Clostridia bacterium]|nr:chemotaxis protein CheC [Clostridia bacterium]
MGKSLDSLDAFQLEALREIGNIGVGNAVTSLAEMLSKKVDMEVPRAGVLPLQEVMALVGDEEDEFACIQQIIEGEAPSLMIFLLEKESALYLVDMMMFKDKGSTQELGEMEESLLKEVGNILSGSILSAFSQMTGITFSMSVPAYAYDMLGAVISTAIVEGGYYADKVLVVETCFSEASEEIRGYFFILPQVDVLEKMLASLGINL